MEVTLTVQVHPQEQIDTLVVVEVVQEVQVVMQLGLQE
jgi:hypothetical protein|tara:strand:- start:282 stop:395 length:114 start_codon:yes stop_codon:yes gene_type:complete